MTFVSSLWEIYNKFTQNTGEESGVSIVLGV